MSHFLALLGELSGRDSAGPLVIVLATIALLHSAVALGRTRQWYLLPVVFGLTALAGFLLNPMADSSTLHDLKARFTSYETLTLLCVVQFLLVSVSGWLGLRMDGGRDVERSSLWLSVLSVLPTPILLIGMLLMEQIALSGSVDARPEAVGRAVGFGMAALVTVASGTAMCLPARWMSVPHGVLSVAMILLCMFIPFLQAPLPQSMALVDWQSLQWLACVLPVAALLVFAGFMRARLPAWKA